MTYFYVEESGTYKNKYLIRCNFDKVPIHTTTGSCAVIEAVLMNISFANYLRLCRDSYGAEIYGKGHMYPIAYFKDRNEAKKLAVVLDKNAAAAML